MADWAHGVMPDPGRRPAPRACRQLCAALLVGLAVAGCAGGSATTPTVATSHPALSSAGPSTAPADTPPSAGSLAGCRPAVDVSALRVVHHFTVSPDDLAVDSSGHLWVTAPQADLLIGLNPDGTGVTSQSVAGAPEGVAIDSSGMYVAQQDRNAIAVITPARSTLITFPNRTANAGIDGIGSDPTRRRLLVPDSPTGELYAVPLDGPPTPHLLASHLGRPVAVTTDSAGDIFVATEAVPGLIELTTAGSRRDLGHFDDLDEVVAYAGLLYVTELDRHDVVAVDPTSGAAIPIAVNLPAPQGLAATATGTLEIVDATTDTLYSMPACTDVG